MVTKKKKLGCTYTRNYSVVSIIRTMTFLYTLFFFIVRYVCFIMHYKNRDYFIIYYGSFECR